MNNDDNIVVALAADGNYYRGLLVTACSMARYASQESAITWVILDGGMSSEDIRQLKRCILKDHPRSEFRVIDFNKETLDGVPLYNGSVMPYARLFLPRLLPDCGFVLYCDVDFLWRADVSQLWNLRDSKFVVQSTVDEYISRVGSQAEDEWGGRYKYSFDRKRYFCTGLCLFNLDRLRNGLADSLIKIMHASPNAPMADQTIMNAVLDEKDIGFLPLKWQRLVCELDHSKAQEAIALHYASIPPWRAENARLVSDAILLWFMEYARVRGISTLRALGSVHGRMFAIASRLAFLAATSSRIGRWLFRHGMRLVGHEGYMAQCVRLPELFRL